jgi:hypothetical protein
MFTAVPFARDAPTTTSLPIRATASHSSARFPLPKSMVIVGTGAEEVEVAEVDSTELVALVVGTAATEEEDSDQTLLLLDG